MGQYIKIGIVIVVLAVGGYVGYRVFVKKETVSEVAGDAKDLVKASKYGKAGFEFSKDNFQMAITLFREALKRADAPDANPREKLKDEEKQNAYKKIAIAHYKIAEKNNFKAEDKKKAIEAYEDYLKKFPDLPEGEQNKAKNRLQKLKGM